MILFVINTYEKDLTLLLLLFSLWPGGIIEIQWQKHRRPSKTATLSKTVRLQDWKDYKTARLKRLEVYKTFKDGKIMYYDAK